MAWRYGFRVLQNAFDPKAPGGRDRHGDPFEHSEYCKTNCRTYPLPDF
jgi:hypothetical protein